MRSFLLDLDLEQGCYARGVPSFANGKVSFLEIFMRVEIFSREFDGKLLLALVAAGRGHSALVCDFPTMMRRIGRKSSVPRLIHMKDLHPSRATYHFHRIFKAVGCLITSLDEEAGTICASYSDFARRRYGPSTVSAADAVFCWGDRDYTTLMNQYPDQTEKFYKTGSPRVDLWGPKFSDVFRFSGEVLPSDFVLVCTVVGGTLGWVMPHDYILQLRSGRPASPGSWNRERSVVAEYRDAMGELIDNLDLIKAISERSESYEILVKPHPTENPEVWKVLLEGLKGVTVSSVPTSELIRQSRAVVTAISTTAIEAAVSGANLINYVGTERTARSADLISSLGVSLSTPEEVANRVCALFSANPPSTLVDKPELSDQVKERFYLDESELAAERIVRVWEDLGERGPDSVDGPPLRRLSMMDFRYWISSAFPIIKSTIVRLFLLHRGPSAQLVKYPSLDRGRAQNRIKDLTKVLGLEGKVRYRFIGKKSILFEPVS